MICTHVFHSHEHAKTKILKPNDVLAFNKKNSIQIPKGNDFNSVPKIIQTEIIKNSKIAYKYSIHIGSRIVNVSFVSPDVYDEKFFNSCMFRIYKWIYVANFYSPKKCSQHLNIYIYLTNEMKNIPSHKGPLTEICVNTAFTTSCKTEAEIHIFRKEEWYKVLIHETIHCLGLDFSQFEQTDVNEYILSLFHIKSKVNLFETYCEMWAEIMNVLFISHNSILEIENIHISIHKTIENAEHMLNNERRFSIFQCIKVLNFYDLKYKDLLIDKSSQNKYKEETNVFAYYILKSLLMFHLNDFMEWCFIHNENSIDFNKQDVENNMIEYCKLIENIYKDKQYFNIIENMTLIFDSIKVSNKNKQEMKTLRMSLYEE
jgi:hypothetical protein